MLPVISIIIEVVIALLALVTVFKGRAYMLGFAVTFGIYVYYDLARLYSWEVAESMLSVVFFVATLMALISTVGILKETLNNK